MDGAALAAERKLRRELSLAWHTAAFSGAAQAGKLKSLNTYLNPQPAVQSAGDILTTLRELQDMGAPMSIRQVN